MLVDKKHPLKKEILKKMINLKIEAEEESNMASELIKFIKSQIVEQNLKVNHKFRGGLLGSKELLQDMLLKNLVPLVEELSTNKRSIQLGQSPTTVGTAQQTPAHVTSQSTSAQSAPNITHVAIIPDPPVNPNPTSVHSMVTRFRVGSNKPTQCLNYHVSSVSPLPKNYHDAFRDSNWQNVVRDEYDALIKNSTWTFVPRLPDTNVVRCMWLFRHKFLADGTLSHYKARLVANGSAQLEGVDVDETFDLVVKPRTIRTVLSLAPHGFQDSTHPDYVCLLQRSPYGLKQAPRAWF
ncbi:ribonuclease H-like domain-containing protein [Tanacetum coccineum]